MEKKDFMIMLVLAFLVLLLFPHFVVFTLNIVLKVAIILAAVVFGIYLYNKYGKP